MLLCILLPVMLTIGCSVPLLPTTMQTALLLTVPPATLYAITYYANDAHIAATHVFCIVFLGASDFIHVKTHPFSIYSRKQSNWKREQL